MKLKVRGPMAVSQNRENPTNDRKLKSSSTELGHLKQPIH